MAILTIFLFGIANFALHKAVLESRHPMLAQMPWFHMLSGRLGLLIEFLMLLGAMLLAARGSPGWAWGYVGYSLLNALSGWLILSRRL